MRQWRFFEEERLLKPTIHDVARAVGVTIGTVSKVLNGRGRISDETRQRVLRAAAEMGYVPSAIARTLAGKNTYTIGLLFPDIQNPYFSEIARGAEDEAFARGYSILVGNTDHDPDKERAYLATFVQKKMDGVVIATGSTSAADIQALRDATKVILLARGVPESRAPVVQVDNREGGRLAAAHLLALGHREMAVIGEPVHVLSSQERIEGFRDELATAGLHPRIVVCEGFGVAAGRRAMERILRETPRVTAVFAGNDPLAIGAVQACREGGLTVPSAVSVVGFDNSSYAQIATPALTTVAQPMYEMGRTTVSLLVEAIESDQQPHTSHRFTPTLVVRTSTGRVRDS